MVLVALRIAQKMKKKTVKLKRTLFADGVWKFMYFSSKCSREIFLINYVTKHYVFCLSKEPSV